MSKLDTKEIKKDFPVLQREFNGKQLCYLDSAATSHKPLRMIERMSKFLREENGTVRRGLYSLSMASTEAYDNAREKVRQFINAKDNSEIIITRGSTESINLVAEILRSSLLQDDDEILISEIEHHANIVPWQIALSKIAGHNLSKKTTATNKLKYIPVQENGELDQAAFKKLISSGKVKILAITHVANSLGTIVPVKEMIAEAHKHGVLVLVDGAQSAQHMKIDVQDLDADFYVFSAHKVYGPTGLGILYAKKEILEKLAPYHGGGEMIDKVTLAETSFAELPFKFEAGTPAIAELIAFEESLNYIEELGMDNIAAHEHELLRYATLAAKNFPGLKIIGEAKDKASLISFTIDGVEAFDLATLINEHAIAIRVGHHCAQPVMQRFGVPATARISFGLYNDTEDIDRFFAALKEVTAILK